MDISFLGTCNLPPPGKNGILLGVVVDLIIGNRHRSKSMGLDARNFSTFCDPVAIAHLERFLFPGRDEPAFVVIKHDT